MRSLKRTLLALTALLGLCGILAFAFPQQVLCVDSGVVQADALVVLGGGLLERPARAAELFRSGAAPKIIVSGAGDDEDKSEERRVGKEWRSRWSPYHSKK